MDSSLTNIQLSAFLNDYERNSHVELLEGAEKDDVVKIAKARGIDLKNNRDLAGFKTVYTIAEIVDANGQRIPKKELLKILPSLVGKPVNINHLRRFVVGHYIDYKFINKTNTAIAYGVFYKSNFADEWEEAKNLFKTKQLGTSSEIWSPKNSWKYLKDGSFLIGQMELAGGALVYPPDVPAVTGADVLAIAKKNIADTNDYELIFSTRYKDDEILTSDISVDVAQEEVVETKETPKVENVQPIENKPVTEKIECDNCGEQFLSVIGQNRCPKCDAILNERGQVLYPPQNINFSLNCLNSACLSNNWLVLARNEDITKIKCLSCSKEYEVTFKKQENNLISQLSFVYSCKVHCPQCRSRINVSGVSKVPERSVTCRKCGLSFPVSVGEYKRDIIESVKEIEIKTSERDGQGKGETKQGDGGVDVCVCSKCGYKIEHTKGTPCTNTKCPKCGTSLVGKIEIRKSTDNPEGGIVMDKNLKNEETLEYEVVESVEQVEAETPEESKVEEVAETVEEVVNEEPKTEEVEEVQNEEVQDVPEEPTEEVVSEETVEPVAEVEETIAETVEDVVTEEPVVEATEAKFVKLYRERIRKLLGLVREIKISTAAELEKATEKIKFYKEQSVVVATRRAELGKYANKLTDEQLVDDSKYELAKSIKDEVEQTDAVAKANTDDISTSSVTISSKQLSDLDKAAKEINKKAFGHLDKE